MKNAPVTNPKDNTHTISSELPSMLHKVARFMQSPTFEYVLGAVIVFNFVLVIAETDMNARDDLTTPVWMDVAGWFLLSVFSLELIFRLYSQRRHFFSDTWNLFDLAVIPTDVLFSIVEIWAGKIINLSALRILRLCRLARLFRMFPELKLMIAGLVGSLSAIFWGALVVLFTLLICGVVAVQFIHPLNSKLDYGDCGRCSRAYSTVFQAALTFTQQIVAGDSWGQVTVPVIEEDPASAMFFLVVYLIVGLALLNLITGVVVTVADNARTTLQEQMEAEKNRERMVASQDLAKLCRDMDANSDGMVSKTEMFASYQSNAEMRQALHKLSIEEEDLNMLWTVLDSEKNGSIELDQLISSVFKLKSSETQVLLTYNKYMMQIAKEDLREDMQQIVRTIHSEDEETRLTMARWAVSQGSTEAMRWLTEKDYVEIKESDVQASQKFNPSALATTPKEISVGSHRGVQILSDIGDFFDPDALVESARQFRLDLMGQFQEIDRRVFLHLSDTSNYLKEAASQSTFLVHGSKFPKTWKTNGKEISVDVKEKANNAGAKAVTAVEKAIDEAKRRADGLKDDVQKLSEEYKVKAENASQAIANASGR